MPTLATCLAAIAWPLVRAQLRVEATLLHAGAVEIFDRSAEAGRIIAAAWVGFLRLELEVREEICLSDSLLPMAPEPELALAFEQSRYALALAPSDPISILRMFSKQIDEAIEIYGAIRIDRSAPASFIARRHAA